MAVTLTLLFVGLWATFALFERGTRAFSVGGAQNDLASDARRSLLAIMSDVRLADADTLSVDDSRSCADESGHSVQRDAFCLATLSRWDKPENFNQVQAGIYWDTYTVVYATRKPKGCLVRQNYRPAGSPYLSTMPGFPGPSFLDDNPRNNPGATSTRVLCSAVQEFQATFNEDDKTLEVSLQLVERGGKKTGGRRL
ncbi:hypothetical protein JST97_35275, partial [bacterium]|nr:hypothetical protein [bacterium]